MVCCRHEEQETKGDEDGSHLAASLGAVATCGVQKPQADGRIIRGDNCSEEGMNQLEKMQIRLDKYREKKGRGRPRKEVAVVPKPMPQPVFVAPPQRKTFVAENKKLCDCFSLTGGQGLDVGDVFWHHRKYVIKKITKTVGDDTVQVEAELTKKHWSVPGIQQF
jgi:hypothetical protein